MRLGTTNRFGDIWCIRCLVRRLPILTSASKSIGVEDPAAPFVKTRPVEVAVGSSKSLDTAKSWLKQCCADHKNCSQLGNKFMPSRCLDVSDIDAISLCITKDQQNSYAALSYCWGPKQYPNLIATKASFNDMLENIPLSCFPLTLRDGIAVTRGLGIRYLWIDALCIVQDDDDDKDKEIPQMRQIFSNAHCTIIAATAAHCHAGFLHVRDLPPSVELCVPHPGLDVKNGHIFLKEYDPDQWTLYDPLEDPVNHRAWTLEERLLSPRRLVYSHNHVRWLCESIELTNGGDPEDRKWPSTSNRRNQMERLPPHLSTTSSIIEDTIYQRHETWWSWLSIVQEYNLRSLTKPKDKLRAIGGIAELYYLKTGDQYCAGLWRSYLAEELLWKVFDPRATFKSMVVELRDPVKLNPRPKYRAPTWSWASVDGAAANTRALSYSPFVTDVFEVIDCVVVPEKPTSSLTSVKSAMLTVRGRLKRALLHVESKLLYESVETYEAEDDFGRCDLDALEHGQTSTYRSVHCLEITSRVRADFVGNQQGLVLVEDTAGGIFNRIGMFGTWALNENWFDAVVPQIVKIG